MRSKKRGSGQYSTPMAGSHIQNTRLNAKQRKGREHIMSISTPKTSVDLSIPREVINHSKNLMLIAKSERAELLWRYKARGLIIQRLLSEKTKTVSGTYEKVRTAPPSNTTKSWYADESGRLIYEPGPKTTSAST